MSERGFGRTVLGIVAVIIITVAIMACGMLALSRYAGATWKPEFSKHSAALRSWFQVAQPTPLARLEFGIFYCCEQAERVKTKFNLVQGDDGEQWWMECGADVVVFCQENHKQNGEWVRIPEKIIHHEGIKTPGEWVGRSGERGIVGDVEREQVEAEFEQLRMDGVLFVFGGHLVCFWPPDFGG
jgi:hypothetical protein